MRNVAVVRFPGSNSDFDALRAAEAVGANAYFVWHRDTGLRQAEVVILPGGFSYGDYLRAGAIARFSPIMQAVQRHAAEGGAVLGICNGFQILCEAHLLPGALMRNAGLHFVSKPVDLIVERNDTPFTTAFTPNQRIRLPVAHGSCSSGRLASSTDCSARVNSRATGTRRAAHRTCRGSGFSPCLRPRSGPGRRSPGSRFRSRPGRRRSATAARCSRVRCGLSAPTPPGVTERPRADRTAARSTPG